MRVSKLSVFVAVAAVLAGADRASAITTRYTSESAFNAAVGGPNLGPLVTFEDRAPGTLLSGDEYASLPGGGGLIFDGLATPPPGNGVGQLNIGGPSFFAGSNYLNIDEVPFASGDGEDDSLQIDIVGSWRAFGVQLIDGAIPAGLESIVVYDQSHQVIATYTSADGASDYFGIIADVSIGRVVFNERQDDSDDVGYDNFRLGNPGATAVPEPGTVAILAAGAAVAGLRGRRRK